MGRKGGRPRKLGERKPSGDLKRPATEGVAPALLARIKANVVKFFADPRFATPFGTLAMEGVFNAAQWAAGNRIAEIYHTYHRLKHLSENPKGPNYEGGSGGSSDLAEERMSAEQLEAHEAKIRAAETAWRTVSAVLLSVPENVRQGVLDLCVYDNPINPALYGAVATFLDQMSRRWPEWRDKRDNRRRALPTLRSTPLLPTAKTTATPKGPSPITVTLERVVHAIRPDLDADGIRRVTDTFHALHDREVLRRGRRNR
jgi:hypothetical protein